MKRILIDLDKTICIPDEDVSGDIHKKYDNAEPVVEVISAIERYRRLGFKISIFTARNMRTFAGDLELIKRYTLPRIQVWLDTHNVPYDEVIVGKPWCGSDGFCVDDRSIRPSEFVDLDYLEIRSLMDKEPRPK